MKVQYAGKTPALFLQHWRPSNFEVLKQLHASAELAEHGWDQRVGWTRRACMCGPTPAVNSCVFVLIDHELQMA